MADVERIQRWLLETAQLIVDHPEAARVELLGVDKELSFRLWAHSSDVGKMVGKQGRTAKSLRILGTAIAMAAGKRFTLDISNDGGL